MYMYVCVSYALCPLRWQFISVHNMRILYGHMKYLLNNIMFFLLFLLNTSSCVLANKSVIKSTLHNSSQNISLPSAFHSFFTVNWPCVVCQCAFLVEIFYSFILLCLRIISQEYTHSNVQANIYHKILFFICFDKKLQADK